MKQLTTCKSLREPVLRKIIAQEVSSYEETLTNVRCLQSSLVVSRYKIKRELKELVADGLIALAHIGGGCDDYGDPCPPYWGYRTTEKIRGGEMYQNLSQEFKETEAKYFKELEGLPYE